MQTVYDREVTLHSRNVQGRNALTERAGRAAVFYKPAHARKTQPGAWRRLAAVALCCGALLCAFRLYGRARSRFGVQLPVRTVLQNPELPNGCEITSCCEVLHYLGFAPDKCELADHYLPRSAQWYGADPDEVYMGNPHLDDGSPETGYYCFAGPIVQAANAYLAVQGSSCRAYDLTGAEEAELASQLQAGNPVIFWATLHFGDIQHDPCGEYDLPGGRRHEVLHTLHCMVLCGMDGQNFVVADPLDFNRVVPRVQFMKIYRQLGRRAVVIKKDS